MLAQVAAAYLPQLAFNESERTAKKTMTLKRMEKEFAELYEARVFKTWWKYKGLSKCQLAVALSVLCDHRMTDMVKVLEALKEIAIEEVKSKGQFTIPGIVMIGARAKVSRHGIKAFAICPLKRDAEQES